MQFQPLTEQQIRDKKFLQTGTYPFTVRSAAEKLPPGGTQSIELVLEVRRQSDGQLFSVRDSLSTGNMSKLRGAAMACGLGEQYNRGKLCSNDFQGRSGYARVLYKPRQGDYPEKNTIAAYEAQGLTR